MEERYHYAQVTHSVQLDCEAHFGIDNTMSLSWYFEERNIYNYNKGCVEYPVGESKYHVERNDQNFILHIKNVTLVDGGVYKCLTISEAKSTKLQVFGE